MNVKSTICMSFANAFPLLNIYLSGENLVIQLNELNNNQSKNSAMADLTDLETTQIKGGVANCINNSYYSSGPGYSYSSNYSSGPGNSFSNSSSSSSSRG
jgi:hypothetical protein